MNIKEKGDQNMKSQNGIILEVQEGIDDTPSDVRGNYSDGYHTFNELYEFRKMYNAALFNGWSEDYNQTVSAYKGRPLEQLHPEIKLMLKNSKPKYDVHKSWKHHNGELCFGGGWFIVIAMLPTGMISNHYKAEDWELFKIPSEEKAKYEYDFHTSQDVIERLKAL